MKDLRKYAVISLAIHIGILIFVTISIKNPFNKKLEDKGYMVFDYVQIDQKSKAPIISKEGGRISKTKSHIDEKQIVSQKNQPTENTPPNHQETKTKQDEKIEKKTSDDDAIALKTKKKDKQKQHSEKNKKTKKANNIKREQNKNDKAVVNLRKNKKKSENIDNSSAKKSFDSLLDDAAATSDNENQGINAEEVGDTLTATSIIIVQQTIKKCWHVMGGLKNAEDLIVGINMELSPDGFVKKAEIADKARAASDPDFKVAAENACRAVLDPECNPMPLPPEKYNEWKELELWFNPKDMF